MFHGQGSGASVALPEALRAGPGMETSGCQLDGSMVRAVRDGSCTKGGHSSRCPLLFPVPPHMLFCMELPYCTRPPTSRRATRAETP